MLVYQTSTLQQTEALTDDSVLAIKAARVDFILDIGDTSGADREGKAERQPEKERVGVDVAAAGRMNASYEPE